MVFIFGFVFRASEATLIIDLFCTCSPIKLSLSESLPRVMKPVYRINAVPRPIPEKKWFMEPWVIVALGGILPFGSIFIEMYFIFTSFWAYKIYYVYGFMLLGL